MRTATLTTVIIRITRSYEKIVFQSFSDSLVNVIFDKYLSALC
nr:MAG TPA: hypothetical protein [Caudoviricetes sp.]